MMQDGARSMSHQKTAGYIYTLIFTIFDGVKGLVGTETASMRQAHSQATNMAALMHYGKKTSAPQTVMRHKRS